MKKKLPLLPKGFLRTHQVPEISAATLLDFSLIVDDSDELHDRINELIGNVSPKWEAERNEHLSLLQKADTLEELVNYMRKFSSPFIRYEILKRVLPIQEAVIPLIFRRYRTSALDSFIESAFYVFCKCDIKYATELYDMYREIRSPYAKANACLVFAEREMTESASLLMKEYGRFERDYPDEQYSDFPLLGLHILYAK